APRASVEPDTGSPDGPSAGRFPGVFALSARGRGGGLRLRVGARAARGAGGHRAEDTGAQDREEDLSRGALGPDLGDAGRAAESARVDRRPAREQPPEPEAPEAGTGVAGRLLELRRERRRRRDADVSGCLTTAADQQRRAERDPEGSAAPPRPSRRGEGGGRAGRQGAPSA